MPSLTELASYLESIAPAQIAESWDNVGVLVRCAQEVTGVLCALDITPATVREARAVGCNAIVSHHPVIFRPLKELRQDDVPALLVREGVSAVCMHTNLDKAQGGVNDVLAQALGLRDTEPFAGGIGRVGVLPETMEAAAFAQFVGKALAAPVKWADAHGPVRRVAVVSGSGGDFSAEAAAAGAECIGGRRHADSRDAFCHGDSHCRCTGAPDRRSVPGPACTAQRCGCGPFPLFLTTGKRGRLAGASLLLTRLHGRSLGLPAYIRFFGTQKRSLTACVIYYIM